jgi:S-adenosylmethionine:tRNA ribosyltransferase-isomerase
VQTTDYHYDLPPELIAQAPASSRDSSRLLVLHRAENRLEHRRFPDLLQYLRPGDVLVVNNSRVMPARLHAVKNPSGGAVELLLLEEIAPNKWWVMLKPGKRVRERTALQLLDRNNEATELNATVLGKSQEGHYRIQFGGTTDIKTQLADLGEVPLPPYIRRDTGASTDDAERYQTVFANPLGSVAAPTAGLHFTCELLAKIQSSGVEVADVTLHVGLGTFAPVKAESLEEHKMHEEPYSISAESARVIAKAKSDERRVIAVGTTSLRVLETVAAKHGQVVSGSGKTRLFVYPPYNFKVVDALLTNFHLPESTLLMLVSAFASPGKKEGREIIMNAYAEAIRERYRFFSYGDAMLIL